MGRFVILLNGNVHVSQRLLAQIEGASVVAADGGIALAQSLNVEPVMWIGDFDSTDKSLEKRWCDVPRQTHLRDKDETDGALAIDFALEQGANEIVLVGAFGGRSDQVLLHLIQLIKLAEQNISCFASDGQQEAWPLVAGSFSFDFPISSLISIVGFSQLTDFSLKGVKWPLEKVVIDFGSSLGISNKVTGDVTGCLEQGRGVALVKDMS